MKLLLGCNVRKPYLFKSSKAMEDVSKYYTYSNCENLEELVLNGKILIECDFEVEKVIKEDTLFAYPYCTPTLSGAELARRCTLTNYDLIDIFEDKEGYVIHLKNLKVFDTPQESTNYYDAKTCESVKKLPNNLLRCSSIEEVEEQLGTRRIKVKKINDYVMLYLPPKMICDILNGKQTSIPKKSMLKELR